MKKLWIIALCALGSALQGMEKNVVVQLQQDATLSQQSGIYCPTCLQDIEQNKPLNNTCPDCIGFITNDGTRFRFSVDMVPEQWKSAHSMSGNKQDGFIKLQDFTSSDLNILTGPMLVKSKNVLAQLKLNAQEIQKEQEAKVMSLQDPQALIELMEKTVQWTADPKEITPLAEQFALLVKDAEFDIAEFAATEGISPEIISTVVSWLKIVNPDLVIPKDYAGKSVVITISFKDWAKYNNVQTKIINKDNKICLDLSGLWLSDISGLDLFINSHNTIKVVDLSNNQLRALTVGCLGNFEYLESVFLRNNQISSVAPGMFGDCPQFLGVDLSCNKISLLSVDTFSNCPKLMGLNLAYNQISSLSQRVFNNCPELLIVSLAYNNISLLPVGLFSNCSSLGSVDLWNNQIRSLEASSFSNCPNITNGWKYFYPWNMKEQKTIINK